jgi:adenylate cyclase
VFSSSWRARPAEAGSPWVAAALRTHEARTFAQVAVVRSLVFAVLAVWIFANYGVEIGLQNLGLFALFAALGLAGYALLRGRPERMPLVYLLVVLDVLLLAYGTLAPGRTYPSEWPWQVVLRQPSFLYFLIFPALALLTFRPLLVFWSGVCVSLAWAAGTWLVALDPGALVGSSAGGEEPGLTEAAELAVYLHPRYVNTDDAVVRVFLGLLLTGLMAYAAWRARRLVYEQAEAARGRANLARYVAPSMVERLASADAPLMGRARGLDEVAVLFVDVQGFTALAEGLSPEATMGLLRGFHARMAEAVFRHRGTLDKFIGDGLMATFGTPEPGPDDAARALACARDMLGTLERLEPRAGGGRGAAARGRDRPPPRTGDDGRHRRAGPLRVRGDRRHCQRRQPARAPHPRAHDTAGRERAPGPARGGAGCRGRRPAPARLPPAPGPERAGGRLGPRAGGPRRLAALAAGELAVDQQQRVGVAAAGEHQREAPAVAREGVGQKVPKKPVVSTRRCGSATVVEATVRQGLQGAGASNRVSRPAACVACWVAAR